MAEKPKKGGRSPSSKKKNFIDKVNFPKIICFHLMGENHTIHHRMGAGVIIMAGGVFVAHSATGAIFLLQFTSDIFGYLLHGIGSIPFVEWLGTYMQTANSTKDEEVQEIVKEEEGA